MSAGPGLRLLGESAKPTPQGDAQAIRRREPSTDLGEGVTLAERDTGSGWIMVSSPTSAGSTNAALFPGPSDHRYRWSSLWTTPREAEYPVRR